MSIRPPVTLPAYTPTRWELRLPDYPIITNTWRSSAFPEILGSLPTGAEWRLEFENMTNAEALALLLPWRATGGGLWALTELPAELAGGVNNDNFKKRLTGTSWAIAREPQKQSVKNGRFNVTIDLIYELTFTSTYGPSGQGFPAIENPLRLNLSGILFVAALPITTLREVTRRSAGPVLDVDLSGDLDIAAIDALRVVKERDGDLVLDVDLSGDLDTAAIDALRVVKERDGDLVLDVDLSDGLDVAATI